MYAYYSGYRENNYNPGNRFSKYNTYLKIPHKKRDEIATAIRIGGHKNSIAIYGAELTSAVFIYHPALRPMFKSGAFTV